MTSWKTWKLVNLVKILEIIYPRCAPSSVPGPHGWHCVAEGPGENQNEKWFDWSHENNGMRKLNTNLYYNIAFVNSERWLDKSRVDITQCQHGNVGKVLSLYFFVLYYKTNIKHFFRIDIQLYQHGKCFIFVK
jgi:hypothetical protein